MDLLNKTSCVGTWTVKKHDISKDGWPASTCRCTCQPDHIVSDGEDNAVHLRLDDVDFSAVQGFRAS